MNNINKGYNPLVSIITIVYNGEKHLEHAIQSVLNQTYKKIEYIVIDGGSKDNSVSIIKKYETKLSYWISEKDKGISDAFNKGLQQAKGEIVGIINADDWYEKDVVEKIIENIDEYDIAYGDLRLWRNGIPDFVLHGNAAYLDREMTINHPTVFVRKKCYDEAGLFSLDYKCAMDYELMMRFKSRKYTFIYIADVVVNMRLDGVSDTKWLLGCKETLSIKNKYLPERKIRNRLYFYKHVLAISSMKFLKKIGLDFLLKIYREKFARVKKSYE